MLWWYDFLWRTEYIYNDPSYLSAYLWHKRVNISHHNGYFDVRAVTSFLYNPIIIYFLPVLFASCALEWAKFNERTIPNSHAHNERISILSFVHWVEFLTLSFNNTVDEEQFNADLGELLPVQSIEMGYFCESSFVS